jgi:hypothetical protein
LNVTRERITDGLRVLLAAGGPFSALILRYTEMKEDDLNLIIQLVLMVVPPAGAWVWGIYLNSMQKKVEAIASAPAQLQQEALNKVSDGAKVLIAEAVPGVETVVVKNNANGELGAIAASPNHPHIVTAKQNQKDATEGYSPKEQS